MSFSCEKKKKSSNENYAASGAADATPKKVGLVEEFTAVIIEGAVAKIDTTFGIVKHTFIISVGDKTEETIFQKDE